VKGLYEEKKATIVAITVILLSLSICFSAIAYIQGISFGFPLMVLLILALYITGAISDIYDLKLRT